MRIRIGSPRSAEEPIGRTVLAPTVALRVFLVRLVRRVVCGTPCAADGRSCLMVTHLIWLEWLSDSMPFSRPYTLFFQPPKGVWTALVDQVLGGAGS
jgi:hypothetical protein